MVRVLNVSGRDPGIAEIVPWFDSSHLPEHLRPIALEIEGAAVFMLAALHDSYELEAGLRKLLEAKDCFVRAKIITDQDNNQTKLRIEDGNG